MGILGSRMECFVSTHYRITSSSGKTKQELQMTLIIRAQMTLQSHTTTPDVVDGTVHKRNIKIVSSMNVN